MVKNMGRSLLVEKNVPRKFWEDAVNWASFVLSRCPTSSVKETMLEEAWYTVIKWIRQANEESKAYRLYDPTFKRIFIAWDVAFEEDGQRNWERIFEEDKKIDLEWEDEKYEEMDESSNGNKEENAVDVKKEKWRAPMDAEIRSIEKNGTWDLMDPLKGVKK
ncbi:hypothetical protein KIW84_058190 [Lathyrus oleraceus]|uniref:Retroviral polymerase SH3-like domain-containing protein n=1 Tax=Pisum sativum TaxID=3888 RepID=A0A9D5ANQ4_PEA|nr:hypothetical protein KIW84_058190 [Pisum sativum]